MNLLDLLQVFTRPLALFDKVAARPPSVSAVFCGYALWIGLIPALCVWVGSVRYGWHFGVGEAVYFSGTEAFWFALGFYFAQLAFYASAVFLSRWIAPTYHCSDAPGLHAAFIAIVGTPLMVGGALYIYPLLPLNLLFLIPCLLYSAYLLFIGISKTFALEQARGMLMAAALLGVAFVGALAAMGAVMILWTHGVGPDIGFNWRSSVAR